MKCQLCQVFVRILEDVKEKENKIMARKDYDQFADELIAAVGGKENIVSVTNCMTRLRFVLAERASSRMTRSKNQRRDERCARCRTVPDPHRYLCL